VKEIAKKKIQLTWGNNSIEKPIRKDYQVDSKKEPRREKSKNIQWGENGVRAREKHPP